MLLGRVEDAGLNASAAPQQRWIDGWIVRSSPGKAKRSRCINAVAHGRLPLNRRLALAAEVYRDAGLPMVVRITPFTEPPSLDTDLARRGFVSLDDTRVMICTDLARLRDAEAGALPEGIDCVPLDTRRFADLVGDFRGSPTAQREAQVQRLTAAPVPHRAHALVRRSDGMALACAQTAREAELVGLYDVFTREDQ